MESPRPHRSGLQSHDQMPCLCDLPREEDKVPISDAKKSAETLEWATRVDADAPLDVSDPAVRLYETISRLYQAFLPTLQRDRERPKALYRRIERGYSSLALWSRGYELPSGRLDLKLQHSQELQHTTVHLLCKIARAIADRLVPEAGLDGLARMGLLQKQARSTVAMVQSILQDGTEKGEDDSDGQHGEIVHASQPMPDTLELVATNILEYARALTSLGPLFEAIPYEMEETAKKEISTPVAQYRAGIIMIFPSCDFVRADGIGKTILATSRNIAKDIAAAAAASSADSIDRWATHAQIATKAPRKAIPDSGLGSSIHTSVILRASTNAPIGNPTAIPMETFTPATHMGAPTSSSIDLPPGRPLSAPTFATRSVAETVREYNGCSNRSFNLKLPPIPPEGANGNPFSCQTCKQIVSAKRFNDWKAHLTGHARPYMCIESSCPESFSPFPTKESWSAHIYKHYCVDEPGREIRCPICGLSYTMSGCDVKPIADHLARDLEQIASFFVIIDRITTFGADGDAISDIDSNAAMNASDRSMPEGRSLTFDPDQYSPQDLIKEDEGKADSMLQALNVVKERRGFYPIAKQGMLGNYLTEEYVAKVLTVASNKSPSVTYEPSKDLVKYALGEGLTLFLMLLQVFKSQVEGSLRLAMEKISRAGLKDANMLPIKSLRHSTQEEKQKYEAGDNDQINAIEQKILSQHRLGCVDPGIFCRLVINDLIEKQWKFPFLGPIFSTNKDDPLPNINSSAVLPWIEKESKTTSWGFAEVSRVRIHEAYIKDDEKLLDPLPESFALKRFKRLIDVDDRRQEEWDKEVANMRKVAGIYHCVRFLTGFRVHELDNMTEEVKHIEFFLLFEWADGGSLRDLHMSARPDLDGNINSSIIQFLGMAKALAEIHEGTSMSGGQINFRHKDLKPENILRFNATPANRIGMLKIGEWGLAKEYVFATRFRDERTITKHATVHYQPPEVEDDTLNSGAPRSRLYDVWSMGCIILEHIIWLMWGPKGLHGFWAQMEQGSEPFYERFEEKRVVHKVPGRWMREMATMPHCKAKETPLGDLLEIVKSRLLVVDLPPLFSNSTAMRLNRRATSHPNLDGDEAAAPGLPVIIITPPGPTGGDALSSEPSDTPVRCLAWNLAEELEKILKKGSQGNYWTRGIGDTVGAWPKPTSTGKLLDTWNLRYDRRVAKT